MQILSLKKFFNVKMSCSSICWVIFSDSVTTTLNSGRSDKDSDTKVDGSTKRRVLCNEPFGGGWGAAG